MSLTPEQVDARSHARARRNQWRLAIIAAFVLASLLTLAGLLQREQARLDDALDNQCLQRQQNALRAVAYYDGIIAVEMRNNLQPTDIVRERIRLYQGAKPVVPVCS